MLERLIPFIVGIETMERYIKTDHRIIPNRKQAPYQYAQISRNYYHFINRMVKQTTEIHVVQGERTDGIRQHVQLDISFLN